MCSEHSFKMEAKYLVFFVLTQAILVADTSNQLSKTGDLETILVDSSNCISTLKSTRSGQNQNLRNKALEYIKQNYEEISRSPEFLDLDISEISNVIYYKIAETSDLVIFNSVKKWIKHNSDIRLLYLDLLSYYIRFENLPKNILLSESQDLCSVNSSSRCHDKITNALQQKEKNDIETADRRIRDSNSTLMVVGDIGESKTFEIFDLRKEKWVKIENFECDRSSYSAVLLKDKVMLIGGEKDDIDVNTVQSYDLNTGVMENLPPVKYEKSSASAVEFKGRVYVIGGLDGDIFLPYVEMWDPVLKIWKLVTEMSTGRRGCGVAVLDEEIFVVGGYGNDGILSEVQSYNPVTNKWRKRASMNEERQWHEVTVVGGYLYAVGGYSNSGMLNTAERYDPTINKWTAIHSLNETRSEMGAGNLFGKLVIVGGYLHGYSSLATMEMYDDENDKWITMPSLNDPRAHFNAIKIPWQLAKATLSREVPK